MEKVINSCKLLLNDIKYNNSITTLTLLVLVAINKSLCNSTAERALETGEKEAQFLPKALKDRNTNE